MTLASTGYPERVRGIVWRWIGDLLEEFDGALAELDDDPAEEA